MTEYDWSVLIGQGFGAALPLDACILFASYQSHYSVFIADLYVWAL
jgi:hypothetical protein